MVARTIYCLSEFRQLTAQCSFEVSMVALWRIVKIQRCVSVWDSASVHRFGELFML